MNVHELKPGDLLTKIKLHYWSPGYLAEVWDKFRLDSDGNLISRNVKPDAYLVLGNDGRFLRVFCSKTSKSIKTNISDIFWVE